MMGFGIWQVEHEIPWKNEFQKLDQLDFEELGIEKDQLEDILDKLYSMRVIR